MENNNEKKLAIQMEQIPFSSNNHTQYYTATDNGQVIKAEEHMGTKINESLLEMDSDEMSAQATSRWRYAALGVSWASIVILFVLGVLGFIVSDETNSSAAFGFGFDCLLDLGTSAVVIWRFMGSLGSVHSPEKERIALLFLGALFIIASVSIFARTIPDLIRNTETEEGVWVISLASVSMVLCLSLAIAKFVIAKKLDSKSLQSDGYSSLAAGITGMSMLISGIVISVDSSVWYLDEIIGLVVGLLLCIYGIKLLADVTLSPDMHCECDLTTCFHKSR